MTEHMAQAHCETFCDALATQHHGYAARLEVIGRLDSPCTVAVCDAPDGELSSVLVISGEKTELGLQALAPEHFLPA